MARKFTAVDAVMNEPVMCGGFIWSYGRILTLLQKDGIKDIYLAAATNRPIDPHAPDTRNLSWEASGELWEALGVANMDVINKHVSKLQEIAEVGR